MGGAASILLSMLTGQADATSPEHNLDEITLRDGSRVRGRVVQEDARFVKIETEGGRVRTFPWDVVSEVDRAGGERTRLPELPRSAWRRRTGGGVTYEWRLELTGLALPKTTFGLTGFCATGDGVVPADVLGQTASDDVRGVGGGLGGRVGYMHLPTLDPGGRSSWWSFRFGAGLDLHVLHSRVPTGIPPANGELCSDVARARHEVASTSEALVNAHVPLNVGVLLALGSFHDPTVWRGVVLGLAWSPSFIQIGLPWTDSARGYVHYVGIEATIDFVTLQATRENRRVERQLRVALFVAPPVTDDLPAVGTLSVGPVWY